MECVKKHIKDDGTCLIPFIENDYEFLTANYLQKVVYLVLFIYIGFPSSKIHVNKLNVNSGHTMNFAFFVVFFVGLKPSTIYYYRCGDPSIPAMSEIFSFKTMPVSGPHNYPGRIGIVADLGLTYNMTTTVSHLIGNKPDLVLLIGDVTYANLYLTNGTSSDCYSCSFSQTPIHETYQLRWDYWGR